MSKPIKTKKIRIADLKPGDKIKSYCPDTHNIVFNEVLDVWDTVVDQENQVELTCTNGTILSCSINHPIMVNVDGDTISKLPTELTNDDDIISDHGIVKLSDIKIGCNRPSQHIDISVANSELFFAQDSTTQDQMILVHNCNQGGIRGGAATVYFPFWHLEFEDLIVLKNNKGTEENRARHMDYGVQFNKLAYERLLSGEDITLFSPSDVPGLYDAFFADQDKFKELYETAERNTRIRKKTVKAIDLFTSFMQERKNTGRIYVMNVDHANTHSSFLEDVAPVKQSNLCAEISLPTKPLNDINDPEGLVALCTLSAINWGKIREPKDFEKPCTLAIRGLDALLSYQHYPVLAAERHTKLYRPLGTGIINFAYWLAKNGVKYSDDAALALVDEYAEAWSYYLIKASVDLAKEQGACESVSDTKYSLGIMPIDTRKKEVDELVPYQERMPWANLRETARQYGIRNSTVMALMPSESSSQLANATNGIEPPRSYISIKQSKDGVLKQVVPEYRRLKNRYDLLWDQASPEGYLKIVAVLQKYIDQSISTNTSYNPEHYPDQQLPMSELLRHLLLSYKWGVKTLYYMNTYDGAGEFQVDKAVEEESKLSDDVQDADCDSCVL